MEKYLSLIKCENVRNNVRKSVEESFFRDKIEEIVENVYKDKEVK